MHGLSHAARRWDSCGRGFGFRSGTVLALDGHSGHGHADRLEWRGVGREQRITVAEALQVNTINGAYATHEEALKGSITLGKLADFVVLAEDLHTIDPEKI